MIGYDQPVLDKPAPLNEELLIYVPKLSKRGWVRGMRAIPKGSRKSAWLLHCVNGRPYAWYYGRLEPEAWMRVLPKEQAQHDGR